MTVLFRAVTRVKHKILKTFLRDCKNFMRNQPSTRKQEHESETSMLRVVTLTNNNLMTLPLFEWRR